MEKINEFIKKICEFAFDSNNNRKVKRFTKECIVRYEAVLIKLSKE